MDKALAQLCPNGRLSSALRQVWAQEFRARRLAFANDARLLKSVDEHVRILDAVMSGDEQAAFSSSLEHVDAAFAALREMLE